jgi:ElaB/YqjD/DUF883 family membrane-anchored ribosome-binding protein
MERNDAGIDSGTGGQSEASDFSGSASTQQPSDAATPTDAKAGFDFVGTTGSSEKGAGIRERAKNVIGTAGGKLADVGSTVREKAGVARDKLADALESGAERLRDRQTSASGPTLAGATAEGSTTVPAEGKIAQVSDRVAGGMDATAEWLRDADIESLKAGLERQVKEHPGRTLLIAAGLGYLIGRAFRSSNQ